jgi:hypothetical protein
LSRLAAAIACATLAATACASTVPPRTVARGALEARFVDRHRSVAAPEASTSAYRALASQTLGAHCRMFPSDSQLYDARAKTCGAVPAAALGFARVLLEVEASPEVLPPVVMAGELRWLDQPAPERCAP